MFDAMKDAIKEETVRQLFMLRKQFQAQAEAMAAAAEGGPGLNATVLPLSLGPCHAVSWAANLNCCA